MAETPTPTPSTSYRYTISIPINPGNADLIDKLERMENGSRSRFTRALMEDGFKHRDEKNIDRYYGVFFNDKAPTTVPTTAPAVKPDTIVAVTVENGKEATKQASKKKVKAAVVPVVDKLAKALDDSLNL